MTPPAMPGVGVEPLEVHADERGRLWEILRADDGVFGQAYVTVCEPGWVKGWHLHERQTDRFTCVRGAARVVLWDDRPDSPSRGTTAEHILDADRPALLTIPPGVWHGFTAEGDRPTAILNLTDRPYDREAPDEQRRPPDDPDAPFQWGLPGG